MAWKNIIQRSFADDCVPLNQLLKRIGKNEHELFRVIDRPEIPLHNNLSESDIRDYVKKEKSAEVPEVKREESVGIPLPV